MANLYGQILRQLLFEISDSAKKKLKEKFKKENTALTDAQMDYYIGVFEKRVANPIFKKKDLFQYTFQELEDIIDKNFPREVKTNDSEKVDFKGSEDVVYSKNGLLILLGDIKEKCIRYGKGYSWCISRADASNMFFSYRMRLNEPVFYFVLDEDKPKTDIWHAIVIYINSEGVYNVATSANTGDKEMSWNEVEQHQPKLKGLKSVFKHIPLTAEERADYKKFKDKVDTQTYLKYSYNEKEKYIGFGHELTTEQLEETPKPLISKYATISFGAGLTKEMENLLPPSDRKVLRDNRIAYFGEVSAMFKFYPEKLEGKTISGDVNLSKSKIESLPDGLKVVGSLDLSDSNIKFLPKGLKVGGSLSLSYSKIESLPDGLKVGKFLYLSGSNIESLPKDLKVGKDIYLNHDLEKKYKAPRITQKDI